MLPRKTKIKIDGNEAILDLPLRLLRRLGGGGFGPGIYVFAIVICLLVTPGESQTVPMEVCLSCHGAPGLEKVREGKTISLHVDPQKFSRSVHAPLGCASCHGDITQIPHTAKVQRVQCGTCHSGASQEYGKSVHGRAKANGDGDAASCADCHGSHAVLKKEHLESLVNPLKLPQTCGKCHSDPELAKRHGIPIADVYHLFVDSIHGRALMKGGLLVAANCSSCHGSHTILPAADPQSTVHRGNISETCGGCHAGVLQIYSDSVHGRSAKERKSIAPVCIDCHTAHEIRRVEKESWKLDIVRECGTCHVESLRTYRDTFHGQVTALGFARVARCSDCHGSHDIQAKSNPRSSVAPNRIVSTCGKCHPNANANFVKFDPHADAANRARNPVLYYAARFMTWLLTGVFIFFGLHTGLWAGRPLLARWLTKRRKENDENEPPEPDPGSRKQGGREGVPVSEYYFRFTLGQRLLHGLLIFSVLGLVASGMPLRYNQAGWAIWLSHAMGGFGVMGFFHRFFAILLTLCFFLHLGQVLHGLTVRREGGIRWGPDSLVPQPNDFREFYQHVKWFLGLGPRPAFSRFTYWEKFDYWAVFWGMAIIGTTGFMLWFPGFFSTFLPGWIFNVALVIHGEEALLAAAFIFAIHFFNSHLRPEKFPMDLVIFTGRVSDEELREERPAEYQRLIRSGKLVSLKTESPPRWMKNFSWILGGLSVGIGLLLFILILIAVLAGGGN